MLPTPSARTAAGLEPSVLRELERLLSELPRRFERLADCGLPATLVHGDFHRGNVRGPDDSLVLLDWGDCGVGHPLLDQAAFLEHLPTDERALVEREWSRIWQAGFPGSDPDRAARLLKPVAALRQAVIYRGFLDRIEPDEQIYHAADPAMWLVRAADFAR